MEIKTIEEYREDIVNLAMRCLGKKTNRHCSQFVKWVLRTVGFPVDNLPEDLAVKARHIFDGVGVLVHFDPTNPLQAPGDLVFKSRHGGLPTHVGVMVTPDKFVDTAVSCDKVRLRTLDVTEQFTHDLPTGLKQLYSERIIGFKRLALIDGNRTIL